MMSHQSQRVYVHSDWVTKFFMITAPSFAVLDTVKFHSASSGNDEFTVFHSRELGTVLFILLAAAH